jgi:hypothetical protein
MSQYFKFYTVEFIVDPLDPDNMSNTKILCNPSKKYDSGAWHDEDFNEETCQCDAAFVKEMVNDYMKGRQPDNRWDGACQHVQKSIESALGVEDILETTERPETDRSVFASREPGFPSDMGHHNSPLTAEVEIERSIIEEDTNQSSMGIPTSRPLPMDTQSTQSDNNKWSSEQDLFEYDDDYNRVIHKDDIENYNYNYEDTEDSPPKSLTREFFEEEISQKPKNQNKSTTESPPVVVATTIKPYVDHSKKICCKNNQKIWVRYNIGDEAPSSCVKYHLGNKDS